MRKRLAVPVVVLSLTLAACSDTVGTSGQTTTDRPSTNDATPAAIAINESNIYEICITKIMDEGQLAEGSPDNVRFAPQSETTTLTRADGFVAVYIDAEDGNNAASRQDGIVCIAKGDVTEPVWYRFGVGPVYSTDTEIVYTLELEVAS